MLITREQVFSNDDIKTERVPVPEWFEDGEVVVRGLTGTERDEFEQSCVVKRQEGGKTVIDQDLAGFRAKLTIMGTIKSEEDRARLFQAGDLDPLKRRSAAPISRIADVVARLSGMSVEALAKAKNDSASDPNDGSTTASLLR